MAEIHDSLTGRHAYNCGRSTIVVAGAVKTVQWQLPMYCTADARQYNDNHQRTVRPMQDSTMTTIYVLYSRRKTVQWEPSTYCTADEFWYEREIAFVHACTRVIRERSILLKNSVVQNRRHELISWHWVRRHLIAWRALCLSQLQPGRHHGCRRIGGTIQKSGCGGQKYAWRKQFEVEKEQRFQLAGHDRSVVA